MSEDIKCYRNAKLDERNEQRLIKGFFDQRNDIGWAYSQFLHLLHAYRHAAHLLGDHSPATRGRASRHMQAFKLRRKKIKEKEE